MAGRRLRFLRWVGDEFEQVGERFGEGSKGKSDWGNLEHVVDGGALFARAFGEADEIDRFEMPRGGAKNASAGDVVERFVDEPEVGEDVAHERMFEDGEARDDEGNFAVGEFFDEAIAMVVLAIE